MPTLEPTHSALLLLVIGALMAISVLFSRASARMGVPVQLLFLVLGMAAGVQGIARPIFENYRFAFSLGTASLALILFDGGLNTPRASLVRWAAPAVVLATLGVAVTAALIAVGAWLLGFGWTAAFLLGAVVSSTDAASVFAVLRGSGLQLKKRVAATLELESGLNDPLAVILTIALTEALVRGRPVGPSLLLDVVAQLVIGAGLGLVIGLGARLLLARARLPVGGLYPVLTMALALVAFATPTLLYGSGFLAVYIAGVVLGNGPIPYRSGILKVHDSAAWLAQVAMFLLLGLLISPLQLFDVAAVGLGLALLLALVARPLAVLGCLLPFRYPRRETAYIGWVGLRGAVPIILATYPVLAKAPGAERIFDLVFFVVVVNALIPGTTVRQVTRRLGLEADAPPPPHAVLEITSTQLLRDEVMSFYIEPACAVCQVAVADLSLPEGAAVVLIVRGEELIAPRGDTVLEPGDHVYVFGRPEDRPFLGLLFGRREEE